MPCAARPPLQSMVGLPRHTHKSHTYGVVQSVRFRHREMASTAEDNGRDNNRRRMEESATPPPCSNDTGFVLTQCGHTISSHNSCFCKRKSQRQHRPERDLVRDKRVERETNVCVGLHPWYPGTPGTTK